MGLRVNNFVSFPISLNLKFTDDFWDSDVIIFLLITLTVSDHRGAGADGCNAQLTGYSVDFSSAFQGGPTQGFLYSENIGRLGLL